MFCNNVFEFLDFVQSLMSFFSVQHKQLQANINTGPVCKLQEGLEVIALVTTCCTLCDVIMNNITMELGKWRWAKQEGIDGRGGSTILPWRTQVLKLCINEDQCLHHQQLLNQLCGL